MFFVPTVFLKINLPPLLFGSKVSPLFNSHM
jgi:hypothetical protein